MKDDNKTKNQLVQELSELRSKNAALEKSIIGDISYEHAAEEARRYAESIVETVREPLLVLDADLKIISANRNFYRTFKVTPGETIGSFIYNLGNKQWDIPGLRMLLEEVLPEKEAFDDFEVDHHFQDIGHKIMLLNARQIYRKDIGAKMILMAIEDITGRKQLENLLIDSEEQYRRLFETASDGIVLLEKREGKITHANPATEEMLGYTEKESIGNKLKDVGVSLDMDDFQTTMQNLDKIGIIYFNNVPVITKSGQHIDTDIYLVDRAKLVQCNIRNITERKQAQDALRTSQEYFKAIIQNGSDIILIVDKLGAITYVSPSIERFLGYRPDELIGKSSLDLIVFEDKPRAMQDFSRALQTKEVSLPNVFCIRHKNGTERIFEGLGKNLLDNPIVAGFVMNIRDITDRKRIEEALLKSEEKFRTIFDGASDGILIADAVTKKFLEGNNTICSMLGYTKEEIENLTLNDIHRPNDISHVLDEFEKQAKGETVLAESLPVLRKDGTIFYADLTSAPTTIGGIQYLVGIFRDMTERKQARDEIAILAETGRVISSTLEIDEVYERITIQIRKLISFDNLMINLFNAQQETLEVVYVSGLDISGRRVGDSFPVRGTVWDEGVRTRRGMIFQSENLEDYLDKFPSLLVSIQAGIESVMGIPLIIKDQVIGNLLIRSKKPFAYTEHDLRLAEKIGTDIAGAIANAQLFTDLKKTETSLRESEGRFRSLFEQAAVGVAEIEMVTGRFFTVNRRFCEIVDRTEEELLAATFHMFTHPEDLHLHEENTALLLDGKIEHYSLEKRYLRKDGGIVWVNITVSPLWKPGETPERNMMVLQDISQRKLAVKELRMNEEKYRTLFESSHDAIMTLAPPSWHFTTGNPATIKMFGTRDEAVFTAHSPWEFSPEFQPDGQPSFDKAAEMIRTAMEKGSHFFEWIHRRLGGESFPATVLLTRMEIGGQFLLQATVRDITRSKRAEENLQKTVESLRKAVGTTIHVLAATVETRDPYTAGHQTRSADLARGIATEMKLPQEKIDAIRIAGSIHDIGKLSIPAEILSKPTRLSEIEFSLIKEHARKGFEMLKDVESPWPLAEIIYQHHERMDGSGYPRNLKGEDICMEARILAVADVVESMASHRPYRPTLGVDAALNEIEKNRGIIYDNTVADACLRLFREKGFQLAEP